MRSEPKKELSPRQMQVAELVAQGLENAEVGAKLGISGETVDVHLGAIYRKRGFRNRTELAAWWFRREEQPA